jgi:hemerythrin-like domain-containing protein
MIDEEEDLFPLIRRRARPEDHVERVLGLLSREHAEDDRLADIIVEGLRRSCAACDPALPDGLRTAMRTFAQRQRRHLAVENAVVMPLAEARLTTGDREGLSRRMAARRGIQFSREGRRD